MAASLHPVPASLKQIQHYLKTATEHDERDPVVAYYCRMYALQRGMDIDKKSAEARTFLMTLMGVLEETKKAHQDEAISNEVVGQAHMESYALKVFLFADNEDRAGRFNKNVVKSFYSAGMLFDVLTNFGEISEDIAKNRKYAKWKAAYIHKCLKSGETPISGPLPEEGDGQSDEGGGTSAVGFEAYNPPAPSQSLPQSPPNTNLGPPPTDYPSQPAVYQPPAAGYSQPTAGSQAPANTPVQTPTTSTSWAAPQPVAGGVKLSPANYQRALKLCKYASSALQYEDDETAIDNLQKALTLLHTGKES